MPHVPFTAWHKIHGDPVIGLVPVVGLAAADATDAEWTCAGVDTITKTNAPGGGITILDGATAAATYPDELAGKVTDDQAVLVVDLDPVDTQALGIGRWRWQAEAGGIELSVVAQGALILSRRLVAAT